MLPLGLAGTPDPSNTPDTTGTANTPDSSNTADTAGTANTSDAANTTGAASTADSTYTTNATGTAGTANATYAANPARPAGTTDATNTAGATNPADAANSADTADATDTADSPDATDATDSPDATDATDATYTAGAHEIVSSVDVYAAAAPATTPAPAAAPGGADRQTHAKRNRRGAKICAGPVIGRIPDTRIGITHWSPDISGIVGGHIDHLRIRLLDHDYLLVLDGLFFDLLLVIRSQSSFLLGLRAHPLDGVHDIALLRQKGITEIGGPLNVIGEAFDHVGQSGHRLNAWIPGLFLNRLGELGLVFDERRVFFEPLLQLH